MSRAPADIPIAEGAIEPAWEVAYLFPPQGQWTEEEYLALNSNRLVEFADGHVQVLPMPTTPHQLIVAMLYRALAGFVLARNLGIPLFAPLRVQLRPGKFREPDVLFMLAAHSDRIHKQYWRGADLVMEVVSDEDRRRDIETRRREYADAGIPEYWIVDPQNQQVTVLKLEATDYAVHGQFSAGQVATSALLPGFEVDVQSIFDAAA